MADDAWKKSLDRMGRSLASIARTGSEMTERWVEVDGLQRKVALVDQLGADIEVCKRRQQQLRAAGNAAEAAKVAQFIERLQKARTRLG